MRGRWGGGEKGVVGSPLLGELTLSPLAPFESEVIAHRFIAALLDVIIDSNKVKG
jgi:hypothetical protein